jgi:hypothetical protein
MNWMKYADWQKLPSGGMWRRDPSSMRFIGLKEANTTLGLVGTDKTTLGSVGTDKTTLGSVGTEKMVSGSVVTAKTTQGSFETVGGSLVTTKMTLGSLGSIKTTSGSIGSTKTTLGSTGSANKTLGATVSANTNIGSARSTSGLLVVPQTTSRLDGALKTTVGSLERLQGTSGTLKTAGGLLGRVKPSSEVLETTAATSETVKGTTRMFGMTARTEETTHRSSGPTNFASGATTMKYGSTCTAHSPIINHIIMLCGLDNDSVMMDYINQEGWTTLNDVVTISINDPNTFHTVKDDGVTFKARPLSKDIRMLKGFIMFYNKMTNKQKRLLDEDDVMDTFTVTDFEGYCTSEDYHTDMAAAGSVSIPSFESLIADGVFHVESASRPSVVVPTTLPLDAEIEQEDADVELEMTLSDKYTMETLFVESWDHTIDDMEEYEVVFEEKDATSGFLSSVLKPNCSDVNKDALQLETDVYVESISQWGAKGKVMYHRFNINQWGATKWEALSGLENGEQLFVAYVQRMLIAVLDSTRVFDPGGQDNEMEKLNQNIPVQQ